MISRYIDDFKDYSLKFANDFSERSLLWKKVGCFSIPVGMSNFGMCGGLASTTLDLFHAKVAPPDRTTPPSSESDKPLFDWLKQRQVESVTLRDFWKYFTLMFTNSQADKLEVALAWKEIKEDIENNRPVLIGLEKAKVEAWYKIWQIANIVKNHQVVVWGFKEEEGQVTLSIYDPKIPRVKEAKISFNPTRENSITWNPSEVGPVYAIFKTSYTPKPYKLY